MLENFFAQTVAAGWAPSNPAGERELAGLEFYMARGTCLEPLIEAGDWLYVDVNMRPEPGDLVCFALSERGAAAQNSALPPGQAPCSAGTLWTKMFAQSHGIDFVLDKYGTAAALSLMGAEHPDNPVQLGVLRQLRRADKLLFAPTIRARFIQRRDLVLGAMIVPALVGCRAGDIEIPELPAASEPAEDSSASQLGGNSATVTAIMNSTGSGTVSVSPGWTDFAIVIGTGPATPRYDCTVIVTCSLLLSQQSGAQGLAAAASFADNVSTFVRGPSTQLPVSTVALPVTIQWQFAHLASNAGGGYDAGFSIDNQTGSTLTLVQGASGTGVGLGSVQVEFIKR